MDIKKTAILLLGLVLLNGVQAQQMPEPLIKDKLAPVNQACIQSD